MNGAVVMVGELPAPPDREARTKERILSLVSRGGWRGRPGGAPWWWVRQEVGGRVDSAAFRALVDELLSEGRLLEVWLCHPDRDNPPHVLLLPGHSGALRFPVARASGRAEVLQREPWYERLLRERTRL